MRLLVVNVLDPHKTRYISSKNIGYQIGNRTKRYSVVAVDDSGEVYPIRIPATLKGDLDGISEHVNREVKALRLNVLMQSMPEGWRYHWCGGGACACMGCSNFSGMLVEEGFTREDWEQWTLNNPRAK